MKRNLLSAILAASSRIAGLRRARFTAADVRRLDHAGHTRRMKLRFSERLRDLFRPAWLRMSRSDENS